MPFKDPVKRREYQRNYNNKRRGGLPKNLVTRTTRIETAHDVSDLPNRVVDTIEMEGDALELEAWGRILLRAVDVGLKIVEVTDIEKRLIALEEAMRLATRIRIKIDP